MPQILFQLQRITAWKPASTEVTPLYFTTPWMYLFYTIPSPFKAGQTVSPHQQLARDFCSLTLGEEPSQLICLNLLLTRLIRWLLGVFW